MADSYNPATDINSPAFECAAYLDQIADVTLVNDCYQGTSAVAAKAQTYLRKYGAEDPGDYQARLSSSKFWNAFRRTVHGLIGLIFRKNPVLQEDVPEEIKAHLEDVDMQGTHIDVFAKERGLRGLIDGHSFVYVDKPEAVKESVTTLSPSPTLNDDRAGRQRPYWVAVDKDQVVNWRVEKVGGVDTLTQVTIWECLLEYEGRFGETLVDQYLVLEPGHWTRYRQDDKKWAVYSEGDTNLDYIPLVPFYSLQTGFFQSTPPLLDVAHENLRHYNLQSSLDRILDLCNVPTPVLKGRPGPPYENLIVGNGVIDIPENGDAKFLEPTGTAISATQNEIDRCKANIASLGLLLLSSQPKVTKTATETTVEYTAETAELSAIARNLQDCIERCLMIHADYMGIESGGSIKVNKDFVRLGIDPISWQRLQDDVANNRLTLETYWKILENSEVLPEDFKAKNEKTAIDKQKAQIDPANLGLQANTEGGVFQAPPS